MPSHSSPPSDAIFGPQRRALTVSIMATMAILAYNDLAIAAALPAIGSDLGDVSLLPWTISIPLLMAGVSVLAAGPLVDGLGPRRVFRTTVTGFVLMSTVSAAAPNMVVLIVARSLLGVAGGLLLTVVLVAIGMSYEADARARVFAANSAVWGVTAVAGPSVAAVMVIVLGWRGVLLFNVPVASFAAVLAWRSLPTLSGESRVTEPDVRGIALVAIVAAAGLAIVEGTVVLAIAGVAVTGLAMVLYRRHADRTAHPVVRLEHIVSARYRTVHLTSLLAIGGALGFHAFVPVYLRAARGVSTTQAAMSVAFLSAGWAIGAAIASRLQRVVGRERTILTGALVAAPGLVGTVSAVIAETPLTVMYIALLTSGIGIGAISTTGINVLQERAPLAEMGRINAAHQFMRTMAITYAVGLSGTIILTTVDRRTGDVEAVRDLLGGDSETVDPAVADALATGFQFALIVACLAAVLCVPAAVSLVRNRVEPVTSAA